jgi:hypothetical protein
MVFQSNVYGVVGTRPQRQDGREPVCMLVLHRNAYGYHKVTVMLLHRNGHDVAEYQLWCWRVKVMVLQSNGYGLTECRLWCC